MILFGTLFEQIPTVFRSKNTHVHLVKLEDKYPWRRKISAGGDFLYILCFKMLDLTFKNNENSV